MDAPRLVHLKPIEAHLIKETIDCAKRANVTAEWTVDEYGKYDDDDENRYFPAIEEAK